MPLVKPLSPAPIREPLVTADGTLSPHWALWFQDLYRKTGAASDTAPLNITGQAASAANYGGSVTPAQLPVVPLSKGGTGATTAVAARVNLALDNLTNDAQVKRDEMGVPDGVATLDSGGKVPTSQLPASSGVVPTFVDAVTPTGTVDGANAVFTVPQAPNPAASLQLFRNGLKQRAGVAYILASATITYQAGYIPQLGDVHEAYYRY